MTTHLCGAALGFFAFAISLIIGLCVGNPFITVVLRSLMVMIVSYGVGVILAGLGQRAVLENLEAEIDGLHAQAEAQAEADVDAQQAAEAGELTDVSPPEGTVAQPPPARQNPVVPAGAT